MSVALSVFRTEVMIEANAPTPLVDREVRHAAIEFCDFTKTWNTEVAAEGLRIEEGGVEFLYTLPTSARVVTLHYIPPGCGRSINDAACCAATWYYSTDGSKVHITLQSDTAALDDLKFAISFKPTQDATTLDDDLYNDNLEAIAHGAKARLMAMPGKDWSNPQLSAYHKNEFEKAKRKQKAEVLNAYTRFSTLTVKPFSYYG